MLIEPYLLSMAGEFRVCSELNKRGVFATITYGHHKSVDLYAISGSKHLALKIEVKTSQKAKFVTNLGKKDLETTPDFWVLCQILKVSHEQFDERFFILTHLEICKIQAERSSKYCESYLKKNGKPFDPKNGVDSVRINDVAEHEGRWDKIITRIAQAKIVI